MEPRFLLATDTVNYIRRAQPIGNNDLRIAAHAMAAGMTLVTNNAKEFRRVRGLKIQNWTKK